MKKFRKLAPPFLLTRSFIDPRFEFSIALFASTIGNLNFLFPLLPGAVGFYETFLAVLLSLSPYYKGYATTVPVTDRIIKTSMLAVLGLISLAKLGSNIFDVLSKKTDDTEKIEKAKEEFAD